MSIFIVSVCFVGLVAVFGFIGAFFGRDIDVDLDDGHGD